MTIQQQIDQIKALLSDAEDAYCFALARGDMDATMSAKREVTKYRKAIGELVRAKLAATK